MIRGIILYYLNIKPTHGYEIQRFLQLTGTDQWAKIQSGSIYYALTKLEKEENIVVAREERTGSRVRKIYAITNKGKETLVEEMQQELAAPICNVGSMKFIISPMLSCLSEEEITVILDKHITELKEQLAYWEKWQEVKAGENSSKLNQISFQMTIDSVKYQIAWHEELKENLSQYRNEGKMMEDAIHMFQPDQYEMKSNSIEAKENLEFATKLLDNMKNDPQKAVDSLTEVINELKKRL